MLAVWRVPMTISPCFGSDLLYVVTGSEEVNHVKTGTALR
jgi:hypothetical protein